MFKKIILSSLFVISSALWFSGCATANTESLSVSSGDREFIEIEGMSTELTLQELSMIAKSMANSFMNEYSPSPGKKHLVVISKFSEQTEKNANATFFAKKFMSVLRKSKHYELSTTLGATKEKMLEAIRKKRDDEEFSEDEKIEKGELKTPDLALSVEIVKDDETIHNNVSQVSYVMSINIVNLKNGIEIWSGSRVVVKRAKLSALQDGQEREMAQRQSYRDEEGDFRPTYSSNRQKSKEKKTEEPEDKEKIKGDYFMMELKLGIGQRNTPTPFWLEDPTNFSLMIGGKLGWTYRWSSKYALTFYGEYEATFQGSGGTEKKDHHYNDDGEEKFLTTNSVGLGARLQMSFFYLSGGALYDAQEFNSDFFTKNYANVNPYVGSGLIFAGKSFGIILGARYVFSLGNEEYLNRGVSADIGMFIAI